MKKEVPRQSINDEEIHSLIGLIKTSVGAFEIMQKAFKKKDSENFNNAKGDVVQSQKKISEVLK